MIKYACYGLTYPNTYCSFPVFFNVRAQPKLGHLCVFQKNFGSQVHKKYTSVLITKVHDKFWYINPMTKIT